MSVIDVETGVVKCKAPATLLKPGEKREVARKYAITRSTDGQYFTCTCPAWRALKTLKQTRSCKHLVDLHGREYEAVRTQTADDAAGVYKNGGFTAKKRASENQMRREISSGTLSLVDKNGEQVMPYDAPGSQKRWGHGYNGTDHNGPKDGNGAINLMLGVAFKLEDETFDPTGWWLTEKLDGVRAWWDGDTLYSRQGNIWNAPEWWKARLPKDLHLDGELWIRRDAFEITSGICRRQDQQAWNQVNFMVFDVTNISALYEERIAALVGRLPDGQMSPSSVQASGRGGHVCVLPMVACKSREHCIEQLRAVEALGGEGLMLRKPKSRYESRRAGGIIKKLKSWYDAEGLVVGHKMGEEKNRKRMGSIIIEMECGKSLECGSGFSDVQRERWEPEIGTIVRYRFQELLHDGTPRFPIFEGCPPDKTEARDAVVRSERLRATGVNDPAYQAMLRQVEEASLRQLRAEQASKGEPSSSAAKRQRTK